MTASPSASRETHPGAASGSGPWRILIVDDNPAIHDDFRKILGTRDVNTGELERLGAAMFDAVDGASVAAPELALTFASQGREAVELVATAKREGRPFATAFVDVRMPPGWDGVETVRRMWLVDGDVQVVICTAFSDYTLSQIQEQLGRSEQWVVLKKPFDPIEVEQLARALATKWSLWRRARRDATELAEAVAAQTAELRHASDALAREMRERAAAERALLRAQKLESLGRIAAGVGHEINNPLTYVIGNLGLIEEQLLDARARLDDESLDEGLEALHDVREGALRIQRIVKDLRAFVRTEREVELTEVPVAEVVEFAARMVHKQLAQKGQLRLELDGEVQARCDRGRLEQVVVNVMMNAVDALPAAGGGTIEVRVAARGERALIEIVDDGVGIPQEELALVCEPFFTTKSDAVGTGLGLAISQRLVESFDGTLRISSRAGAGTRVSIELPRATGRAPVRCEAEPVPVSAGRLLVIDDEPAVLRAVRRQLGHHRVDTAASVEAALSLCQGGDYELILCDVMLGDELGSRLHAALRAERPELAERMVFCTGGAFTDAARTFLGSVATPVIAKPIRAGDVDQLLLSLRQRLDVSRG